VTLVSVFSERDSDTIGRARVQLEPYPAQRRTDRRRRGNSRRFVYGLEQLSKESSSLLADGTGDRRSQPALADDVNELLLEFLVAIEDEVPFRDDGGKSRFVFRGSVRSGCAAAARCSA
jgi:hypothetical protein